MDAVYVCRDGVNPELRFSLRSLVNVPHDRVHVVGGHPDWLNTATVLVHRRAAAATKYATTTGHLEYACGAASISDPFLLFNDDFYAVLPVVEVEHMHRGDLDQTLMKYRALHSVWAQGMRVTARALKRRLPGQQLYSYEVHVPLVVHKQPMIEALQVARSLGVQAPHKRTIYGNVAGLGGVQIRDPKLSRDSTSYPTGAWLSSDDGSFATLAAPILRGLFPGPCRYESVDGCDDDDAAGTVAATSNATA